eukprot:IDg20061t1
MASKRGGSSRLPQSKHVIRSAGNQPNMDEPLIVSSEFADISQLAHEQVLQEKVTATQQWIAAPGAGQAQHQELEDSLTHMGTQIHPEEPATTTLLIYTPLVPDYTENVPKIFPPSPSSSTAVAVEHLQGSDVAEFQVKPPRRDADSRLIPAYARKLVTRPLSTRLVRTIRYSPLFHSNRERGFRTLCQSRRVSHLLAIAERKHRKRNNPLEAKD